MTPSGGGAGFDGAPRFLGIDRQGREVLSYVEGEVTADHVPVGLHDDAALTGAARLLRRSHDATEGFAGIDRTGWQFQVGAPAGGPVICHNEVGPHNTVYRGGRPVAFIDWDFAAPAPRARDIAYALWRFVPLYDDRQCARLGWPVRPTYQQLRADGRLVLAKLAIWRFSGRTYEDASARLREHPVLLRCSILPWVLVLAAIPVCSQLAVRGCR